MAVEREEVGASRERERRGWGISSRALPSLAPSLPVPISRAFFKSLFIMHSLHSLHGRLLLHVVGSAGGSRPVFKNGGVLTNFPALWALIFWALTQKIKFHPQGAPRAPPLDLTLAGCRSKPQLLAYIT